MSTSGYIIISPPRTVVQQCSLRTGLHLTVLQFSNSFQEIYKIRELVSDFSSKVSYSSTLWLALLLLFWLGKADNTCMAPANYEQRKSWLLDIGNEMGTEKLDGAAYIAFSSFLRCYKSGTCFLLLVCLSVCNFVVFGATLLLRRYSVSTTLLQYL